MKLQLKHLTIIIGLASLIIFSAAVIAIVQRYAEPTSSVKTGDRTGKTGNANRKIKKLSPKMARIKRLQKIYAKKDSYSDNVGKILDESLGFRDRWKEVHGLSRQLSDEDIYGLLRYLKYGKNNKKAHVLKNDIMNALRDQQTPPPELTDVLLDLFYDKSQDMTVRCYALQHMRPWYLDEQQHDPAIVQAFYDGLKETDTEIAGVALLALRYLAKNATTGNFDSDYIAEQAAAMVESNNTYILSRITAVAVSSEMGVTETLPTVRTLAEESNSVVLKVTAIAALGKIGEFEDIKTLRKLTYGKRPYSTAAKAALKKLQSNPNL